MNIYEETYFISGLVKYANEDGNIDLNNSETWKSLFLYDTTKIHEDYFWELNEKGIISYEEIREDGFAPIVICSVRNETIKYHKELLSKIESENVSLKKEIENLNTRISDILTFDPYRLSNEISKSKKNIDAIKHQIANSQVLTPLVSQLKEIEDNLNSIGKVSEDYEEVYKNIILPIKQEGQAGVKQTVKWAIISIIISTVLSALISWCFK